MEKRADSDTSDELQWSEVQSILRAHWLLIVVVTVVVTSLAAAYAFVATPMYRAEVTVRPTESESGAPGGLVGQLSGLASVAGIAIPGGSAAGDAFATLNSTAAVEAFVVANQIEPELRERASDGQSVRKAVRRFKQEVLTIKEDQRNNVILVSIVWSDPEVAAEWANGIVGFTNELLRARDKGNAERSVAYLNKELAKAPSLEMQRVLYQLIERETQTLMLADARPEYALKVLDSAYAPEWHDSPRRIQMLIIGFVLGAGIGVLLAILRDASANRKKSSSHEVV